jgi:hypothetical protein
MGEAADPEDRIAEWDAIVAKDAESTEPEQIRAVAAALYRKGHALIGLGRYEEAAAALDDALGRFGGATDGPSRSEYAKVGTTV